MATIRKAKLGDVPNLLYLWKEFMEYHDEMLIKQNPRLKPHLIKRKNAEIIFKKFIKKNIRSKNSLVSIAEVNGKPAGYSLIYIKTNIPVFELGKIGHISDLFVKKQYRGMKISSKFKNEGIIWFKKKRIKYISLQVYTDNKFAHSIYKKWGFFDYHIEMRRRI